MYSIFGDQKEPTVDLDEYSFQNDFPIGDRGINMITFILI